MRGLCHTRDVMLEKEQCGLFIATGCPIFTPSSSDVLEPAREPAVCIPSQLCVQADHMRLTMVAYLHHASQQSASFTY